jgi:hypothetical protein
MSLVAFIYECTKLRYTSSDEFKFEFGFVFVFVFEFGCGSKF